MLALCFSLCYTLESTYCLFPSYVLVHTTENETASENPGENLDIDRDFKVGRAPGLSQFDFETQFGEGKKINFV